MAHPCPGNRVYCRMLLQFSEKIVRAVARTHFETFTITKIVSHYWVTALEFSDDSDLASLLDRPCRQRLMGHKSHGNEEKYRKRITSLIQGGRRSSIVPIGKACCAVTLHLFPEVWIVSSGGNKLRIRMVSIGMAPYEIVHTSLLKMVPILKSPVANISVVDLVQWSISGQWHSVKRVARWRWHCSKLNRLCDLVTENWIWYIGLSRIAIYSCSLARSLFPRAVLVGHKYGPGKQGPSATSCGGLTNVKKRPKCCD